MPPAAPYDVTGWTLPLQMGVDVRTIERWFETPAMSRLRTAEVAPARLGAEQKPAYSIVDARGNGGAIAANRLLAAGLRTAWTTSETEVDGYRYASGSLVVPYSKAAPTSVEKIAAELGLRADGVKGKAPATTRGIGRARVGLYKPWIENVEEGWTRWVLERYEFPFRSLTDADVRAGSLRAQFDAIVLPSAAPDQLIDGHWPGTVPTEFAGELGQDGVAALEAFVAEGGTLVCLDLAGGLAVSVGAGRVVLIGFRAQHRGQSLATFRLLFNAILTAR